MRSRVPFVLFFNMQKVVLPAKDSGVAYVHGIQAAVAAKVVRVLSDRENWSKERKVQTGK